LKKHHNIKLITASIALMTSLSASAGLGGLNVQSHLGEPFTGSITVTGEEAQVLLNGGKATISNGNLRAAVRKSGDKAVVTIRSSKAIKDPVLVFQVGVTLPSSIRPDTTLKMRHPSAPVKLPNPNPSSRHAMPNSLQLKTIKQQVIR